MCQEITGLCIHKPACCAKESEQKSPDHLTGVRKSGRGRLLEVFRVKVLCSVERLTIVTCIQS